MQVERRLALTLSYNSTWQQSHLHKKKRSIFTQSDEELQSRRSLRILRLNLAMASVSLASILLWSRYYSVKSRVCLNAGSFLHVWGRICLTIMIIRYAINSTFRSWYGMPRHKILWRRLALGELNSTPQVKATGLYLTVPSPRNDIVFCDVRHELWNCVREIYIQVEFRKFLQNICTMNDRWES